MIDQSDKSIVPIVCTPGLFNCQLVHLGGGGDYFLRNETIYLFFNLILYLFFLLLFLNSIFLLYFLKFFDFFIKCYNIFIKCYL